MGSSENAMESYPERATELYEVAFLSGKNNRESHFPPA